LLSVEVSRIEEALPYLRTAQVSWLDTIAGGAKTWTVHQEFGDRLLDLSPTNSLVKEKCSKYENTYNCTVHSIFKNMPSDMSFMVDFDDTQLIEGKSIFDYVLFFDEYTLIYPTDAFKTFIAKCIAKGTKIIFAGDRAQISQSNAMLEWLPTIAEVLVECNYSYRARTDKDKQLFKEMRLSTLKGEGFEFPEEVQRVQLTNKLLEEHKDSRWICTSNEHEIWLYYARTGGRTLGLPVCKEGRSKLSVPYEYQLALRLNNAFSQLEGIGTIKRAQGLDTDEPIFIMWDLDPAKGVSAGRASTAYTACTRNKDMSKNVIVHAPISPKLAYGPVIDLGREVLTGKEYRETEKEILVSRFTKADLDKLFHKQKEEKHRDYYLIDGKVVKLDIERDKKAVTFERLMGGFWSSIVVWRDIPLFMNTITTKGYKSVKYKLPSEGIATFSIDENSSYYNILAQNKVPLAYSRSFEPIEGGVRLVYAKGCSAGIQFEGLMWDLGFTKIEVIEELGWFLFDWTDGHIDWRDRLNRRPGTFKHQPAGKMANTGMCIVENEVFLTQAWSALYLDVLIRTVQLQRAILMKETFGKDLVSITVDAYNFGDCDITKVIDTVNSLFPTLGYKVYNMKVFNQLKAKYAEADDAYEIASKQALMYRRTVKYKTMIYDLQTEVTSKWYKMDLAKCITQRQISIYCGDEKETPEEFLARFGAAKYQDLPQGKRKLYAKNFGLPEGVISDQERGKQNVASFNLNPNRLVKQRHRLPEEEIESRFHVVETAAELISKLGDCQEVVFDTETYEQYTKETRPDGVIAYLIDKTWQDTPFSLAMCNGDDSYVLYGTDEIQKMADYFAREDITFIAHNAKFDRLMLENVGVKIKGRILDTMTIVRLVDENKAKYKLEVIASSCMNDYQSAAKAIEEYKKEHKGISYRDIPRELMTPYTCGDVWNCYQIYAMYIEHIPVKGLESMLELESNVEDVLYFMTRTGVKVDVPALQEALEHTDTVLQQVQQAIDNFLGYPLKVSSTQQLRKALLEHCPSYPSVAGYTDKGLLKADKAAIEDCATLEPDNEFIQLIQAYKLLSKADGAYLPNLLKFADKNGYIHPVINSTQARTGRMSISNPALQQIPKDIKDKSGNVIISLRKFFTVPEGFWLVLNDLDQVEYRCLAEMSGCITLINHINNGYDIHSATAGLLFNKEIDWVMEHKEDEAKHMRSTAKTANFAIVYGQGNVQLARALAKISRDGTPTEEHYQKAVKTRERYFNAMPEISDYIDRTSHEFENIGYIRNPFGRYRHKTARDGSYKAVNAQIQGMAADYFKSKLVLIYKYLKENNLLDKVKPVLAIHDEVQYYVSEDCTDIIPKLQELMCDRENYAVDITADCSISTSTWADKKSFKGGSQ
jgi:DNA polymerase I-like protein with 3'-5' exonuclease and polymerase domains